MIGTRLKDRYCVEAQIGQGGMGLVYRAYDEQTGQPVAIKILSPRPGLYDQERRFRREFRALSGLNHPHVVSVYDHGQVKDRPFFVMEYVGGGDLRGLIESHGGRLGHDVLLPLAIQLCQALSYIHAQGVVHRDLKPENVLLATTQVPYHLKLTDFGLAQIAGPDVRLTQAGELLGTVLYMAPEQARGQVVDHRADLYALGIILYEILTGRHPFPGNDPVTILVQQIESAPAPLRQLLPLVPEPWQRLVLRLMAKSPADRFASAEEMLVILRSWADTVVTDSLLEPRAGRVEQIFRAPVVGREAELFRLREAVQSAARGEGPVVFIRGEAGVGKTRLMQELAAASDGTQLWLGKSYEAERLPYQPFIEILGRCYRQMPQRWQDAVMVQPLAAIIPELAADQAGASTPAQPAADVEAEKLRLFNAVAGVLGDVRAIDADASGAPAAPVIVCLDDLQWADASSLELFAFLARVLAQAPVLLCATYRSEEVDGDHPVARLQRQLARQREVLALDLEPLDRAATSWMVAAMFGDMGAVEELGRLVYEEAEGNPFFAEEIVKALVEEGAIYRAGGKWRRRETDGWWVPAGIRSLLEHRLNRLGSSARAVVAVASVVGRRFDFDTLRLAGRFDEDTLLDVLDELLRARVIREDPTGRTERYDFNHDKMREVAYAEISPARRKRLHQRVAEALEQRNAGDPDPVAGELARHYELAGDLDKAITWAERAGQAAQARLAIQEALDRYRRATELADSLPPDPDRGYRLLYAVMELAGVLGQRELVESSCRQVVALAEAHDWTEKRVVALLSLASYYIQAGEPARSEAICTELMAAIEALGDVQKLLYAQAILGIALKDQRRLDEARCVFEQCLEQATQAGMLRYVAVANRELGNALVMAGDAVEGLAYQQAALELLRRSPHALPTDLAFTLSDLAEVLYQRGEYAAAAEHQAEALAIARQTGYTWVELAVQGDLGCSQMRLGEWGAARTNLQVAVAGYRRLGERLDVVRYELRLAEMERHLGNASRAYDLAADALALARRRESPWHETESLAALALAELATGNRDAALAHAGEAVEAGQRDGRPGVLVAAWLARGEVALALGDDASAVEAAERVLELEEVIGQWDRAAAAALRSVALASRIDLEAAWAGADKAGNRPAGWRVALALAAWHRQAGDERAAQRWQRTAEEQAAQVADTFEDPALAEALRRNSRLHSSKD